MDAYYDQYNNPDDLSRYHWNVSQERQQDRLSGGSWSQPPWAGWKPSYGAGRSRPSSFYQRFAQDGDSGFFHGLQGSAEPLGMNPIPPNPFHPEGEITHPTEAYAEPEVSTIAPVIVEPSPVPDTKQEEMKISFHAEPEQRATYAPPYSQTLKQGMGKIEEGNVLYEEPFELPKYKGGLHKKGRR